MDNALAENIKIWLPPMLTLLGTLIVMVFTAWLNTRALFAHIEALRHEVRADAAVLKLELSTAILRMEHKLDHVIDTQASHSERLAKLEP